jgi:hypothetical protein
MLRPILKTSKKIEMKSHDNWILRAQDQNAGEKLPILIQDISVLHSLSK